MIWEVKLYVGGTIFVESVHAVNRQDALDTAKARNPKAKVIGVNPTLRNTLWTLFVTNLSQNAQEQDIMEKILSVLNVNQSIKFITLVGLLVDV